MENNNNNGNEYINIFTGFLNNAFDILQAHYDTMTPRRDLTHERSRLSEIMIQNTKLKLNELSAEQIKKKFGKEIYSLLSDIDLNMNQKTIALAHLANALNNLLGIYDEMPEILEEFNIAYDRVSEIEFPDKSKNKFSKDDYLTKVLKGNMALTEACRKYNDQDSVDSLTANLLGAFVNCKSEVGCNVVNEYLESNSTRTGVLQKLIDMIQDNEITKVIFNKLNTMLISLTQFDKTKLEIIPQRIFHWTYSHINNQQAEEKEQYAV